MAKKKVSKKVLKKKELTDSNKMQDPNYQNFIKIELLEDVATSLGHFKKGEIKDFPAGEAEFILSKGLGKEIK